MKLFLLPLALTTLLSSCTLFGGLSREEQNRLSQSQYNADSFYKAGRYDQAIQQANQGLKIDSNNETLIGILAWSHLRKATRDDVWKSEELFDQIDRRSWLGLGSETNWYAVFGHGLALRRQGDFLSATAAIKAQSQAIEKYEDAADRFERALELDPKNTEPLDALQQVYALSQEYEKSLDCGKRFVDAAMRSRPFWENQLKRLDISSEEEKIARSKVESNLKREVASRSLAASVLFKLERFSESLEQLDELLKLDPEKSEEYFNRALCREALADTRGTVEDLDVFLKKTSLGFESAQIRQAYDLINKYSDKKTKDAQGTK